MKREILSVFFRDRRCVRDRGFSEAGGVFVLVGSMDVCFVEFLLDKVGALCAEWRSAAFVASLSYVAYCD